MQQLSLVLPQQRPLLSAELLAAFDRDAVMLVPNRRVAQSLAYAYARHHLALGNRVWPTPQVYTLQAWVERLWTQRSHRSSSILMSAIQLRRVWQQIVDDSEWAQTLLAPTGVAATSLRSYQTLKRWNIPVSELASFDATEVEALRTWIGTFEDLCSARDWLAPFGLADELIRGDAIAAVDIAIVGFDALAPAEVDLLAAIERKGGRVTNISINGAADRRSVVCAADANDELVRAAYWARLQVQLGLGSIAVVVPNLQRVASQVRRAFADVFSPSLRTLTHEQEQAAFALAVAQPLGSYPIVQAALDILELAAGNVPSTLVGLLLRSPFLVGAETEASLRALADARLRQEGRELFDIVGLEIVASAAGCTQLALGLRSARALLEGHSLRHSSEWSDVFVNLWHSLGWPGERSLTSDEQQTVAKLQELLGDFGSLDAVLEPQSYARAVAEFRQLVNNTQFEPRTGATQVTVLDLDDAIGMRFDSLWICGMDAGRWPPPSDPDPFIPLPLQLSVGIPEATAAGMREKYRERFEQLCVAGNDVVFSWVRMDADVEQVPSPWITSFNAWESAVDLPGYRYTLFAGRTLLDEITELSAPPLTRPQVRGGTRIAELSAQCAFRAQVELRLQAHPLARVSPALDALERGNFMHNVLSDFWSSVGSRDALLALSRETRQQMLRELLGRHSANLLKNASQHRAQLVAIEMAVAQDKLMEMLDLEALRPPFKVYRQPELKAEHRIAGLDVQVRFDRIDELADGRRVVIDYKTGGSANANKWWGERPEQPQLPLYAVLESAHLAAVTFAQLGIGKVGFEGIAREDRILPGIHAYPGKNGVPPERATWERLLPYWRVVIERLFERYASGVASVDPLPQACRYCHLSTVCRIHEIRALAAEDTDD